MGRASSGPLLIIRVEYHGDSPLCLFKITQFTQSPFKSPCRRPRGAGDDLVST